MLQKYFDIGFIDIFKHETFIWQVQNYCMEYSQEYTEFLIEKVYPYCKPEHHLPSEIITEREVFYKEKRETNPEILKPMHKFIAFYNSKFGEGRFVSKFGAPNEVESNARTWNWDSFNYT